MGAEWEPGVVGAGTVHWGWDRLAPQRVPFQLLAEGGWDRGEDEVLWRKSEHFQM